MRHFRLEFLLLSFEVGRKFVNFALGFFALANAENAAPEFRVQFLDLIVDMHRSLLCFEGEARTMRVWIGSGIALATGGAGERGSQNA